jgi:formiminotetrahydrofolate cyclodeaminase
VKPVILSEAKDLRHSTNRPDPSLRSRLQTLRIMYDGSTTIADFLTAAGAKQPTPGGGSVSALAGALAASMGEMVVNYSVGKKDLAAHDAELREAVAEFARARAMMLELMVEDQAAYEAMAAVRKLPADSPQRREQFAAALGICIQVPQAIATTAAAVLDLCERLVDKVNRYLLSDLAVCAELAMATVRCGGYNVRVNLLDVAGAVQKQVYADEARAQVARGVEIVRRAMPRIWRRMDEEPGP